MVCFVQMLSSSKSQDIIGFNQLHKDFLEVSIACFIKDILIIPPPIRLYFLKFCNRTNFITGT